MSTVLGDYCVKLIKIYWIEQLKQFDLPFLRLPEEPKFAKSVWTIFCGIWGHQEWCCRGSLWVVEMILRKPHNLTSQRWGYLLIPRSLVFLSGFGKSAHPFKNFVGFFGILNHQYFNRYCNNKLSWVGMYSVSWYGLPAQIPSAFLFFLLF